MLSHLTNNACSPRATGFFVALALQLVFFFGSPSHADELADAKRASEQLGLALPGKILGNPAIAKQLGALARERCDRQAVYQLSKALEEESYRREAAESLVSFSDKCGGYADGIRRAINLLLDVSDYFRSAELADKLITMEPNGDRLFSARPCL